MRAAAELTPPRRSGPRPAARERGADRAEGEQPAAATARPPPATLL